MKKSAFCFLFLLPSLCFAQSTEGPPNVLHSEGFAFSTEDARLKLPMPILEIGPGGRFCGPATVRNAEGVIILILRAGACLPADAPDGVRP